MRWERWEAEGILSSVDSDDLGSELLCEEVLLLSGSFPYLEVGLDRVLCILPSAGSTSTALGTRS